MKDICLNAVEGNTRYKNNLLKTGNRLLVEAISGNFFWSSDLNHQHLKQVKGDKLPGRNAMGTILMEIRESSSKLRIQN